MNYFVHSVMYAYYAAMGSAKLRPKVKKFAIYITLLQLLQMARGGVRFSAQSPRARAPRAAPLATRCLDARRGAVVEGAPL